MELNMFKSKKSYLFRFDLDMFRVFCSSCNIQKTASKTSVSRRKRLNNPDEQLDEMLCEWMTFLKFL